MKSVLYLNLQASHVFDLFDNFTNLSRKIWPTVGSIKEVPFYRQGTNYWGYRQQIRFCRLAHQRLTIASPAFQSDLRDCDSLLFFDEYRRLTKNLFFSTTSLGTWVKSLINFRTMFCWTNLRQIQVVRNQIYQLDGRFLQLARKGNLPVKSEGIWQRRFERNSLLIKLFYNLGTYIYECEFTIRITRKKTRHT